MPEKTCLEGRNLSLYWEADTKAEGVFQESPHNLGAVFYFLYHVLTVNRFVCLCFP